jgi:hypothetical protein
MPIIVTNIRFEEIFIHSPSQPITAHQNGCPDKYVRPQRYPVYNFEQSAFSTPIHCGARWCDEQAAKSN